MIRLNRRSSDFRAGREHLLMIRGSIIPKQVATDSKDTLQEARVSLLEVNMVKGRDKVREDKVVSRVV